MTSPSWPGGRYRGMTDEDQRADSPHRIEGRGSQNSQLQEIGILMAEIARRLRARTSAIELAIRRKNSEEGR
jgi:hypothetical protein